MVAVSVLIVCLIVLTRRPKEGLSDERGCLWDPVNNQMRCNVR